MKKISLILLLISMVFIQTKAQEIFEGKLEIKKKKTQSYTSSTRDSTLILRIDTLIMHDNSSIQFNGVKNVTLVVKHAKIGNKTSIWGKGSQFNASNFDINIHFDALGSMYIVARGQNAINGTRTYPNGDGGLVKLTVDKQGIQPQTENKKAKNYLYVDVQAGGATTNPNSDLQIIYDRIARSKNGLLGSGLPQGQIYSGSMGKEGKVVWEVD